MYIFFKWKKLKSNLVYTQYLTSFSNILYLNEIWLRHDEKHIVDSIPVFKNKKILFKSDMDSNYVKGSPFGGHAFIIDDSFIIREFDFLNKKALLCFSRRLWR